MARVLLFGAVWIVVLAAAAVAVHFSVRPEISVQETAAIVPPPAPPPRPGTTYPGWTVTAATSAHHTMVVEVEAVLVGESRTIAAQIIEPIKDRYDEVLVYVREPDQPKDALPARRIQWTKRTGYTEMIYRQTAQP